MVNITNKKFNILLLCFLLIFSTFSVFITTVRAGNFSSPVPYDGQEEVFYQLSDDGVKVNLSLVWTGVGPSVVTFTWDNETIIGTDTVNNGETAKVTTNWLDFATEYTWNATDDDGGSAGSYSFVTCDVYSPLTEDWTKSTNNPSIPLGAGGAWNDVAGGEGTTCFYDAVGEQFVILFGGGDAGNIYPYDLGVRFAENMSVLKECNVGGYTEGAYNPLLEGGPFFASQTIDEMEELGEVKLYCGKTNDDLYLYTNDGTNWSDWTNEGLIESDNGWSSTAAMKLNDTYILMNENCNLYYSDDGTSLTADGNNPVITAGMFNYDSGVSTPTFYKLYNYLESDRIYCSIEISTGGVNPKYVIVAAYASYADLIDGDNSSTWTAYNNGNYFGPYIHNDTQGWEGDRDSEGQTFYFEDVDPDTLIMFFESQVDGSHTQSGTSYTTVYGYPEEPQSIQFLSIESGSNNSVIYVSTPTINWTTIENASYYHLEIDNNGDFSSPELNYTDINEINYPINCDIDDTTVSFTIPNEISSYGNYYMRVRACTGN